MCLSVFVQIQHLGIAAKCQEDDEVRMFYGMLDGLAYLPIADVEDGMRYVRQNIPDVDGLIHLVKYFDNTYVSGSFRRINARRGRRRYFHPKCGTRLMPP